jgi:hypothetical protein
MVISRWILLSTRNASKKFVHKIKTHILPSVTFFFQKFCHLWDNVEKYGTAGQATDNNITRRMRFTWWVTMATDTHSECVILIAFPRQSLLEERVPVLCYAYIACLVFSSDTKSVSKFPSQHQFRLSLKQNVITFFSNNFPFSPNATSWSPFQLRPNFYANYVLLCIYKE